MGRIQKMQEKDIENQLFDKAAIQAVFFFSSHSRTGDKGNHVIILVPFLFYWN
jgi:hypothetical protein